MKQNGKTINSYFIFIILLLLVIFGLNLLNNRTDEYTRQSSLRIWMPAMYRKSWCSPTEKHLPDIWRSR